MNIIKYELKRNFKSFCFWCIGLFALAVLGMYKYEALASSGVSVTKIFTALPKIVFVIFGMNDLDILSIDGYYGVLFIYILITGCLYAIQLGVNSTALEVNDKTSEFIFSKPRSRYFITTMKQLTGIIYLILFTTVSYLFTLLGFALIKTPMGTDPSIGLLTMSLLMVSLIYFAIGALFSSISNKRGGLYTNLLLLITYMLSIIYDLSNVNWLRYITPIKYFNISDVVNNNVLQVQYIIISVLVVLISLILSNIVMSKKNLE